MGAQRSCFLNTFYLESWYSWSLSNQLLIVPVNDVILLLFSCPVMSNSLWPNGLQHARPPCPSPSPEVCPSSCPLHWQSHPTISSSDALFSFCSHLSQHQGLFQWVSCSHQMTKYWSFNISISSSDKYSGLISLKLTGLISDVILYHKFSGLKQYTFIFL